MGEPLLFLSHAGADTEAARALKERLENAADARKAGLKVWFDKDSLEPGTPLWQAQIEDAIQNQVTAFAVYVGAKGVVNWVENEVRLAISRATATRDSERPFAFIPIISKVGSSAALPGFAQLFQAVRDIEDGDQLQKLVAVVLGDKSGGRMRIEDDPFFDLHAIDETRSHLFFGRDDETQELLERLRHTRLVMIVGDSGSGKSSLARAGLMNKWRGGDIARLGRYSIERSGTHSSFGQIRTRGDRSPMLSMKLVECLGRRVRRTR